MFNHTGNKKCKFEYQQNIIFHLLNWERKKNDTQFWQKLQWVISLKHGWEKINLFRLSKSQFNNVYPKFYKNFKPLYMNI